MPISFDQIPANLRVPGVYTEVDASRAQQGLGQLPGVIYVIAQKLAAGSAGVNTPVWANSLEAAKNLFGRGSQATHIVELIKKNNSLTPVYVIPVDDVGGGTAASGTLTFTGTATNSGTIHLYIGGRKVSVPVASGQAHTAVAAAVNTAINADGDLPVTSAVASGVVTITARHKGTLGNSIGLQLNYYAESEALPAGIACAVVAMASGATDPDVTTALAALPEDYVDTLVFPYTDSTNLNLAKTELDNRWGLSQLMGHAITARKDSLANHSTWGNSQNNPHITTLGMPTSTPNPTYEIAAALAGQAAAALENDPARPLTDLPLVGILAPAVGDRYTSSERQVLLFDGISTFEVSRDGTVRLNRVISNYQLSPSNSPDTAFLDITSPYTLAYLRKTARFRILGRFPRHKLAKDSTQFGAGQAIVTPKIARAELVALFTEWEALGLVEDIEQFKRDLIVEINATDPTRLDVLMPPNLINPLIITAMKFQYLL